MDYSYEEFLRLPVHSKYPWFIRENLDILYRMVLTQQTGKSFFSFFKNNLGNKFFFEGKYLASLWGLKKFAVNYSDSAKVLILFLPYRKDLAGFIYPVAKYLAEKGVEVAVLRPKRDLSDEGLLCNKVKVIDTEGIYANWETCQEAKKFYRLELLRKVGDWCREIKAGSRETRSVKIFFQKYALDQLAARKLLKIVNPQLIYGIQYILNPGWLAAINSFKKQKAVKNILIQHGFYIFNCSNFHDFKGADSVIVWGDYQRRFLETLGDVPLMEVIGNPKLEASIRWLKTDPNLNKPGFTQQQKKVLFVSTRNISNPAQDKDVLGIFLKSVQELPHIEFIVKLHPNESLDCYESFLKNGLMKREQILIKEDVYPLIYQSDLVVGSVSTALFEAVALEKPVIQIGVKGYGSDYNLSLLRVVNSHELRGLIQKLVSDPIFYHDMVSNQRASTKDYFNMITGSAEKIADYIINYGLGGKNARQS